MLENYAGNLIFNDGPQKFILQKDKVKTLTEKNDISVDTMHNDKYLTIKVGEPGTLQQDTFEKSTPKNFACLKANYKELNPFDLFGEIWSLLAKYEVNQEVKNKPQAYYSTDYKQGIHEISKDEFYKE